MTAVVRSMADLDLTSVQILYEAKPVKELTLSMRQRRKFLPNVYITRTSGVFLDPDSQNAAIRDLVLADGFLQAEGATGAALAEEKVEEEQDDDDDLEIVLGFMSASGTGEEETDDSESDEEPSESSEDEEDGGKKRAVDGGGRRHGKQAQRRTYEE